MNINVATTGAAHKNWDQYLYTVQRFEVISTVSTKEYVLYCIIARVGCTICKKGKKKKNTECIVALDTTISEPSALRRQGSQWDLSG